jgi:hypothetical protein
LRSNEQKARGVEAAVPRHHFDMLVNGIPAARARLIERAGHTLIWTHTHELAEVIRAP